MESFISTSTLVSAIGLGLLIGVVRERAHPDHQHTVAGVRTHLMAALAGALGAALGTAVLVAMLVLLGALSVASYIKTKDSDPGLTGEVALPVTALLAALAHSHPALAAGLSVIVAAALYAKRPLHRLVREKVSEQEFQDALLLAGAALVVLPLLPGEAVDPWGVLVPSRLWRMVVLIMAVGMLGHLALRVVGARWGLPLAGFLAGFASSTAAVAGFGHRARDEPAHVSSAAAGALFANFGSLCLIAAVVGAASPALLRDCAPALLAAGVALLLFAGVAAFRHMAPELPTVAAGSAFRFSHALLLAGLIGLLLLVSALIQQRFGSLGVMVAAAAVAVVEVHAAAASVAQLAFESQLQPRTAAWGLVLLVAVAALSKSVLAFVSGGPRYGWRVAAGLSMQALAMAVITSIKTIDS